MGFSRTYDSQQSLATLAALPGSVVVRQTPAQAPVGAGSGCVLLVGEPTNDQGSDPDKTLVNTPREITSGDQVIHDYGGISQHIGSAANGWEGAIGKALALPGLEFARLALIAPDLEAGLVRLRRPGAAASVTPTNGPTFYLWNGVTLILAVDGGGEQTATLEAIAAALEAAAPGPYSLTPGMVLEVAANGGTSNEFLVVGLRGWVQSKAEPGGGFDLGAGMDTLEFQINGDPAPITFTPNGSAYDDIGQATAAEIANDFNAQMIPGMGAEVFNDGINNYVRFYSTRYGSSSLAASTGGTKQSEVFDGLPPSVSGTGSINGEGDIANLGGATADELAAAFTAAATGLGWSAVASMAGSLRLVSSIMGTDSSLQVSGTANAAFGFSTSLTEGSGDVADASAATFAEIAAWLQDQITGIEVDADDGTITATAGSLEVAGGTAASIIGYAVGIYEPSGEGLDELSVPAGTRVSDGGSAVYLTLEDATFAADSVGPLSVRVRPQTDTTAGVLASGITTILGLDGVVVDNPEALVPTSFDTAYANALAASLGDTGIAAAVDYVVCRRHTAGVHAALRAHGAVAATGKRPRVVFLSPPVGTSNAAASGSGGVGAGRFKYAAYCYPGFRTRLADEVETLVDMTADLAAAHLASVLRPEQNIGEDRDRMVYVLGLESGLDVTPTQAQYRAWLEAGIMPLQIVDGRAELLQDVTTLLSEPQAGSRLYWVRMVNWLTASLHGIGGRWAKKLRSTKNKEGLRIELDAFLGGLKSEDNADLQRIADYAIDDESGNTQQAIAAGLHVVKLPVQLLGPMDTIVFQLEAGVTVKVSAQAVAAG